MTPRHGSPSADSSGLPWEGRTFTTPAFADDDGTASAQVQQALQAVRDAAPGAAHSAALNALGDQLLGHRVLLPVVAIEDDGAADVGMVTVWAPDGRQALPVFTSVAAMASWRPDARPVPHDTRRALLAAVHQECQVVRVDVGTDYACTLPRPAVWAWAQGKPWVPFLADPAAQHDVATSLCHLSAVRDVAFESAEHYEVCVVASLPSGMSRSQVAHTAQDISGILSQSEQVAERIDSITIRFVG